MSGKAPTRWHCCRQYTVVIHENMNVKEANQLLEEKKQG